MISPPYMDQTTILITEIIIACVVICIIFYFWYFLRQPKRSIPYHDRVFASPASGKIISIIQSIDEFVTVHKDNHAALQLFTKDIGDEVTIVSIMLTPFDVHYQRSMYPAQVIHQSYHKGKFKNAVRKAKNLKSTFSNEHNQILFQTHNNIKYKIIQIAGFVARRIVSYVQQDQVVQQGDIIWLIKLGSQVTIVFDHHVEVIARVGQKVIDGETILALIKDE